MEEFVPILGSAGSVAARSPAGIQAALESARVSPIRSDRCVTYQVGLTVLSANSKVWLLEFALRGRVGPGLERTPVMARVPEETLIAWCKAQPDSAPAFAAATLPVLAAAEDGPARPGPCCIRRWLG